MASGIHDDRVNFLPLLEPIEQSAAYRPQAVLITYRDRLARLSLKGIEKGCEMCNRKSIETQGDRPKSPEEQLMADFLALPTAYAGK